MALKRGMSKITLWNWWIDSVLFTSALVVALSSVYFLYIPTGGYQGGRNPYYNLQLLFTRHTWDDLHTWGGIVMIAVAIIHLILHWPWVVNMTRRAYKDLTGINGKMNWRGRLNLLLNVVVGISFLMAAASGIYFLFFPGGNWAADPMIVLTRLTWDLIHTWSGIVLFAAALIHFAIHWRWVVNVTVNISQKLALASRLVQSKPVLPSVKG
jgi:hypothetical protein